MSGFVVVGERENLFGDEPHRRRHCWQRPQPLLLFCGWGIAVVLAAVVIAVAAATALRGDSSSDSDTEEFAASNGCLYSRQLVVDVASQAAEFYKCGVWHSATFSANALYDSVEQSDISGISTCYWDFSALPLEQSTGWIKLSKLKADLATLMADDGVKTTEKLRLKFIANEVDLYTTLVSTGHLFEAHADATGDYAWYLDPLIDSGRTLSLLLAVDHSSQSGYDSTVLGWLQAFATAVPQWETMMRRAVSGNATHASVVMKYQASYYREALSANYSKVCATLHNNVSNCLSIAATINGTLTSFSEYFEGTYLAACEYLRPDERSGLWATANGTQVYAAWLQYHLGLTETAANIHALGVKQVAQNKADILSTIQLIDSNITTYAEASAALSNQDDQRWFICTNDSSEVIDFVRLKMAEIEDGLIPEFGYFAGIRVQVVVTGSASTSSSMASYDHTRNFWSTHAYYNVGRMQWCTLADNTSKTYYYERTQMATVAHEAMPGHGHQLQLEAEVDCAISSYSMGPTLYTEGWALYAESLLYGLRNSDYGAKGLYHDPLDELSYYTGSMLRNVRLVVDTGLHASDVGPLSWSDCVAEMVNDSFSEYLAQTECERYIQMPGQATAYMLGSVRFKALRNNTSTRLGDCFDAAEFHNVVLRWGSMDFDSLEELVNTWVMYKLNPSNSSLSSSFGYDIIRDELLSSTKPTVGLGRQATDETSCTASSTRSMRKEPVKSVRNLRRIALGKSDIVRPFTK